MEHKFSGKVALITGSSRGIGKEIAIELAKKGAYVVINGRNKERLSFARKEIENYTQKKVLSICCDITVTKECEQLINTVLNTFGRLDILINNAGVSMRWNLSDLNPVVFSKVFSTNILGTVNITIPVIPEIRKSKGSIVFISSVAGIRGLPSLSAYCSSKMALRAIAESIRIEESQNDIHVGLIYLGATEIDNNKETISSDGSKIVLSDRSKRNVLSKEYVAKSVLLNIKNRKFITTLSFLGILNKCILFTLRRSRTGDRRHAMALRRKAADDGKVRAADHLPSVDVLEAPPPWTIGGRTFPSCTHCRQAIPEGRPVVRIGRRDYCAPCAFEAVCA